MPRPEGVGVTSSSWDQHQREVKEALHTIVSDPHLGVPALSSSQTMSNLLKDLLPDAPRETSVLVAAAEAGLAQVLQDHVSQGMDVATASSLTASAFAARAPYTPDACQWVVGELAVALGLAREAPAPPVMQPAVLPPTQGPGAPPVGGQPRDKAVTQPAPETVGAGVGTQPPPGSGPAGAQPPYGATPYGGSPFGTPPYGGGTPQPPARQRPKTWMIVVSAVAVVAVIGIIIATMNGGGSGGPSPVEPLHKIIASFAKDCKSTPSLGMKGLTSRQFCQTDATSIGLDAYQFDNTADYEAGLLRLNTLTGWDPSVAGDACPPPAGHRSGSTGWHSFVNPKYKARPGQSLECYTYVHNSGLFIYLWTLPTQRVILVANDQAAGASFENIEKWWAELTYG
jgi:hypothetical protein